MSDSRNRSSEKNIINKYLALILIWTRIACLGWNEYATIVQTNIRMLWLRESKP